MYSYYKSENYSLHIVLFCQSAFLLIFSFHHEWKKTKTDTAICFQVLDFFFLLLMSVSYNWKTSEIFWSKLSLSLTIRLDPVIAGSLICHWFFKYSAGKEHRFTPDDEWLLWKFNHLKRDISTRDPILKANSCTALILFSQRFQGIQTLQEVQKGFCPCDNLWLHQSFSRQEKKKSIL